MLLSRLELLKAKEQIAALERELERVYNQRQFSVSTKGSEQEQDGVKFLHGADRQGS